MALSTSLGLARKVLKKVYVVESDKVPNQFKDVVGRIEDTTQLHELFKQMAGFEPAARTNEGQSVIFDSQFPIYTLKLTPILYTKGVRYSKSMQFTNQYKEVTQIMPQWAKAFKHRRNIVFSNLDSLGFTDTTYGVNGETLYKTSHDMRGQTFSNRPATELVYSPIAHRQAMTEIRKQKSARGTPQPYIGKLLFKFPAALEAQAVAVINTMNAPGTNNNDTNEFIRRRSEMVVNDYYTSDTAWFVRAMDNDAHGLVGLDQMPYDTEKLARDAALMDTWVGSESYAVGWYDAHGTWGTTGVAA